jgi:hypothetical protein
MQPVSSQSEDFGEIIVAEGSRPFKEFSVCVAVVQSEVSVNTFISGTVTTFVATCCIYNIYCEKSGELFSTSTRTFPFPVMEAQCF